MIRDGSGWSSWVLALSSATSAVACWLVGRSSSEVTTGSASPAADIVGFLR